MNYLDSITATLLEDTLMGFSTHCK